MLTNERFKDKGYSFSLCTFSRSSLLAHLVLAECPLGLTAALGHHCPCRRRIKDVPIPDTAVISCTFPRTWHGTKINTPAAFAAHLRRQYRQPKGESS